MLVYHHLLISGFYRNDKAVVTCYYGVLYLVSVCDVDSIIVIKEFTKGNRLSEDKFKFSLSAKFSKLLSNIYAAFVNFK